MPSLPLLDEPLRDARVALRDAAERDIPEVLIAHDDDPGLHLRRGLERAPTGAQLGREAELAAGERAAGRSATLTILETGSDTCRGQVVVHPVDWDQRRADIGIWLAPQARGRGLAAPALRLAATWLIERGGLERVQAFIDAGNAAMVRAAHAAGFRREGTLRGYLRRSGARVDVAAVSLVRRDLRP